MTLRQKTSPRGTLCDALLVHPETGDHNPCRILLSRRGLAAWLAAEDEGGTGRPGAVLRVPWWSIGGIKADDTDSIADGTMLQVLEVATESGVLSFLLPATAVSSFMHEAVRWARRWSRRRQPAALAMARERHQIWVAVVPLVSPAVSAIAKLFITVVTAAQAWLISLVTSVRSSRRFQAVSAPLTRQLRVVNARGVQVTGRVSSVVSRTVLPVLRRLAATPAGRAVRVKWGPRRAFAMRALVGALGVFVAVAVILSWIGTASGPVRAATNVGNLTADPGGGRALGITGIGRILGNAKHVSSKTTFNLPAATAPPSPAPPSVADAPPLQSHEVFGFAPYWTLPQSTGFDVNGLTTIAYFTIGVNPDGSLTESGAGWDGYQSQELADLVTRGHAAGDRVVLTVNCFAQSALDALTSSATAPATLSAALVKAIAAKNLDGVNLDFEGEGSADQAGLTNLVTKVSAAVHGANSHYQVTMDTYASSAGDPSGFYNIHALAPSVDGFFVMAYELNLQSKPNPGSPLTSSMFSDLTTITQYAAAVPPSKVIMGLPYYGYDWPTQNGTMSAGSTGASTAIAYSQIIAKGTPIYWDSITNTAWTSYQVGGQWHEAFFEDPYSIYQVVQMAQSYGLNGVGTWALGMDGNDPQMMAALDGNAPPSKVAGVGPTSTTPSASSGSPSSTTTTTLVAKTATGGNGSTKGPTGGSGGGGSPSGTPTTTTTTTTTVPASTTTTAPPPHSSGTWNGSVVNLNPTSATEVAAWGAPTYLGQLTGFTSNVSSLSCLSSASSLNVWRYASEPSEDVVIAQQPADCTTADFTFPAS